ncbi:MAG: hypothetical protein AAGB18_08645 [Pseudomonadota bacterium]
MPSDLQIPLIDRVNHKAVHAWRLAQGLLDLLHQVKIETDAEGRADAIVAITESLVDVTRKAVDISDRPPGKPLVPASEGIAAK